MSPMTSNVSFTQGQDAQRCEDIWIAGVDFQTPRQLTHISSTHNAVGMGKDRLINWRSLDSEELNGTLLLPAGYDVSGGNSTRSLFACMVVTVGETESIDLA